MLSYNYIARNPANGAKVKAEVQADSEQAASRLIREEGLVPIDITLNATGSGGRRFSKVSTKDRVLFSRQMSTLINAGLPLVQSLRNVNSQSASKPLQAVISKVIADVEAGTALSVAMSRHPKVFNQVYISMIAAGEASGTLDLSLQRLADQQEKDADIVAKVRGAMIYPAIVMVVMAIVMSFMLVKVLPQVEVLYEGFPGAELPLVTRILLWLSHLISKFWWVVIILAIVGSALFGKWIKTGPGKEVVDKFKMRAPLIKSLFMKMYTARFARTGSTLVSSGVPLIQMLEITGEAVNNVHIARSIDKAIEKVKGGKSLADALDKDPNFLELLPNMLRIGEQSGSIEQMLGKTADYYEKEVDNEIKSVQTIIEPVMMVFLGISAFVIVAAVLLPVYSLAGKSFTV
ncbi:MAG TPA: type II secretion system F family protein [Candidatus Saccharimonadales bacterium]|jgi:type IV pilus assembly protein PilC